MAKVTKESINNAVNKIAFVADVGGIPIYDQILKNYVKGYKPAKDFVKNLARMIDEGEFKTNVDIINYLSNLAPNEIVPYSYSKYPKVKEQTMETKKAWCVKTHIVDDYETISDDVRLFNNLEDAEKVFNNIVKEEREAAIDNELVIEYDDNRNFEAYEEGYYSRNHSSVNLFQIEIE